MVMTYKIKDMGDWESVDAELLLTDVPFGIEFGGDNEAYNRNDSKVSGGYMEWSEDEYGQMADDLMDVAHENLISGGNLLVFSGWQNAGVLRDAIEDSDLSLRGKMYYEYNFAPYCRDRPAHNVYEIFWATAGDDWYYSNECDRRHCLHGEGNLSTIDVTREYRNSEERYPTQLQFEVVAVLIEHFSESGYTVFDPLAGSGMVGVASEKLGRTPVLGDLNPEGKEIYEQLRKEHGMTTERVNSVFDW